MRVVLILWLIAAALLTQGCQSVVEDNRPPAPVDPMKTG
jgi:hypothetical protein